MTTHLQTKIRNRYRIEMGAAKKGIPLSVLRKKLKMKQQLFSMAVSGERKKAHQRVVKLLESL